MRFFFFYSIQLSKGKYNLISPPNLTERGEMFIKQEITIQSRVFLIKHIWKGFFLQRFWNEPSGNDNSLPTPKLITCKTRVCLVKRLEQFELFLIKKKALQTTEGV